MKKDSFALLSLILLWVMFLCVVAIDVFGYPLASHLSLISGSLSHAPKRNCTCLLVTLYTVSLCAFPVLFYLRKLLKNILQDQVFIPENARCLSFVVRFLAAAAILLFISGFYYLPFFLLSAIAGFVAVILQVIKHCFDRAIAMKDELDYTI